MRALVTGARGFVGSHLVRHLAEQGDDVIVLDRAEADVCDGAALAEAVRVAVPDAIFHLAAQSSVARSFADPAGTFETNVLGTLHLLEAARMGAPRARIVVASSADVYGSVASEDLPLRETSALRPASPYAASKAALEIAALQYRRAFGLRVVVARSFNAVGPGQSAEFALPAFAAQMAVIARGSGEPVIRVGNLDAVRDLTDVRDIARAYALLADRAEPGETYNVCSGTAVSIRCALELLIELSGIEMRIEVEVSRLRPLDVPCLVGNCDKLHAATGWTPAIALRQSLADLYASVASGSALL